jgi:hypothetical protein
VEDTGSEMVVQDTGSEPEEEVWEREVGGLRLLGRLSTSGCTKQAVKALSSSSSTSLGLLWNRRLINL